MRRWPEYRRLFTGSMPGTGNSFLTRPMDMVRTQPRSAALLSKQLHTEDLLFSDGNNIVVPMHYAATTRTAMNLYVQQDRMPSRRYAGSKRTSAAYYLCQTRTRTTDQARSRVAKACCPSSFVSRDGYLQDSETSIASIARVLTRAAVNTRRVHD